MTPSPPNNLYKAILCVASVFTDFYLVEFIYTFRSSSLVTVLVLPVLPQFLEMYVCLS